jgi:integrase/recombinase XerD
MSVPTVAAPAAASEGPSSLTWERAFQLYDDYLRCRRAAPLTIYEHQRTLRHLRGALEGQVAGPAQVTIDHLRRYQLSLLQRRLAAGTVANSTARVRSFFGFLYLDGLLEHDAAGRLEPPRIPRRPPGEVLTPKEVQSLVEATAGSQHPLLARAILETLYCTGVRRGELMGLDLFDLDHRERTILVRGKGEKPRVLPVVPTCYEALSRYLDYGRPELERAPTPALFLGPKGGRISQAHLARVLRDLQDRAGLTKQVTPHTFRRSCATGLLKNGTNLKVIQAILGHDNLETTSVYLNLSPEEVRGEVLGKHPRERFEA